MVKEEEAEVASEVAQVALVVPDPLLVKDPRVDIPQDLPARIDPSLVNREVATVVAKEEADVVVPVVLPAELPEVVQQLLSESLIANKNELNSFPPFSYVNDTYFRFLL